MGKGKNKDEGFKNNKGNTKKIKKTKYKEFSESKFSISLAVLNL
jgi:hypothetical protein